MVVTRTKDITVGHIRRKDYPMFDDRAFADYKEHMSKLRLVTVIVKEDSNAVDKGAHQSGADTADSADNH